MTVNMVLSTFSVRKISSVSLAAVSDPLFYTIADYIFLVASVFCTQLLKHDEI